MSKDYDDVDKLLNEARIADFQYRSFDQNQRPALQVVRSAGKAPAKPEAAPEAKPRQEAAAATPPPAAPASSAPVNEAFARLSRGGLSAHAPRFNIQLNLPPRPPLLAQRSELVKDQRLKDVFERLNATASFAVKSASHSGS